MLTFAKIGESLAMDMIDIFASGIGDYVEAWLAQTPSDSPAPAATPAPAPASTGPNVNATATPPSDVPVAQ